MIARIMYQKETDTEREGYNVEIWDNESGWGLDTFYPLVRREYAKEDEERNFVHFGIINKIRELKEYGYNVIIK